MLSAVAIIPSAPVMVPDLAGAAAAEVADLRAAVVTAAGALPDRWVVVGTGPGDERFAPELAGTFAGYGVDVPVALSPDHGRTPTALPLCGLIAGWVRGQVRPQARAQVRVYADTHEVDAALRLGRQLRGEIDESPEPVGVLVVADGANTLTPPAPGGYDPDAVTVQQDLDAALAGGDPAALAGLSDVVVGRVAYQVLAGLGQPHTARELYRGAPYGVGYFVGTWAP